MAYWQNLIRAAMGREPEQRGSGSIEDPNTSPWDALTETTTSGSGEIVTPKKSLSIPAFFQGCQKISGDVAKLSLGVFERTDSGRKSLPSHSAYGHVHLSGQANDETNAFKFWRRFMTSCLLFNNGYAWIDWNGRGDVIGLYNLLSDRTTPVRIDGRKYYLTEVRGELVYLPDDEVLHVEGLSIDGMRGIKTTELFVDLFGSALAKQRFQSKFFKNNMTAGGILAVPPGAKPTTVKKLQASIKQRFTGAAAAFRTLVLRDGYKWFSTQIDPSKAQLTESTEQDAREVARVLNLRASQLSVEGSTSYNSDENAKRDYHDSTLAIWLCAIACECNAKLRTAEEKADNKVYFEHNVNRLLWADAKTRNEIAVSGIQAGRWSPDETRAWENMDGYEGGDTYYQALNVAPVGSNSTSTSSESERSTRGAANQLAISTLERAQNRMRIRNERGKPETDSELAQLRNMIAPACTVLDLDPEDQLRKMRDQCNS